MRIGDVEIMWYESPGDLQAGVFPHIAIKATRFGSGMPRQMVGVSRADHAMNGREVLRQLGMHLLQIVDNAWWLSDEPMPTQDDLERHPLAKPIGGQDGPNAETP